MGLLARLVGVDVGSVVKAGVDAVDRFVRTPDEKAALDAVRERMAQDRDQWQVEINRIEAAHRSLFVAGWRPAVGWVCGAGLVQHFLINVWLRWIFVLVGRADIAPPGVDIEVLVTLLLALLGMSGLRTFEKRSGVARG